MTCGRDDQEPVQDNQRVTLVEVGAAFRGDGVVVDLPRGVVEHFNSDLRPSLRGGGADLD